MYDTSEHGWRYALQTLGCEHYLDYPTFIQNQVILQNDTLIGKRKVILGIGVVWPWEDNQDRLMKPMLGCCW